MAGVSGQGGMLLRLEQAFPGGVPDLDGEAEVVVICRALGAGIRPDGGRHPLKASGRPAHLAVEHLIGLRPGQPIAQAGLTDGRQQNGNRQEPDQSSAQGMAGEERARSHGSRPGDQVADPPDILDQVRAQFSAQTMDVDLTALLAGSSCQPYSFPSSCDRERMVPGRASRGSSTAHSRAVRSTGRPSTCTSLVEGLITNS